MKRNDLKKIRKAIRLIDYFINNLNKYIKAPNNSLHHYIRKEKYSFSNIFFTQNKLDELFTFLISIEKLSNISRILDIINNYYKYDYKVNEINLIDSHYNQITPTELIKGLQDFKNLLKEYLMVNTSKIFFSWQSDSPNKTNRNFIESSINKAISNVNNTLNLHLELDKDTINRTGSPDIVNTILNKIENSFIFIADISLVIQDAHKKSPNPNVLYELGYAQGIFSEENIIMIFNCNSGNIDDLPFDLKNKRIMKYTCSEDMSEETKKENKRNLIKQIENQLLLKCTLEKL
ncbi:hypothetical protein [Megamonas funiformis]|uniref:hypothetical protein n=1 Tax=Megamonas funiformis TaxID=437897 RepID=UPI00265FA35C|nr:hypothetical protein [Megamonas funiformis]